MELFLQARTRRAIVVKGFRVLARAKGFQRVRMSLMLRLSLNAEARASFGLSLRKRREPPPGLLTGRNREILLEGEHLSAPLQVWLSQWRRRQHAL